MIQHRKAVASLIATVAFATLAPVLAPAFVAPVFITSAWALDPPPADPSKCGGLVCDLGLYGGPKDSHTLPCNDFFCGAFGGRKDAPPPEPVASEPAPDLKPAKKVRRVKAHPKSVTAKPIEAKTTMEANPDAGRPAAR